MLPLVFICLISCRKNHLQIGGRTAVVDKNLSYGKGDSQKYDLYTSDKKDSASRTFIFIHGGGWRGGDKKDITGFMLSVMEEFPNDIFVNTNYTLADYRSFALPEQTDEIHQLISHLNSYSDKSFAKTEYILVGNSAGGHLAALYAYKYRNPQVIAVVNIVGPVDLSDKNFQRYPDYGFVQNYLVNPAKVSDSISKSEFASPITWMPRSKVRIISFFGENDTVIPLSQKLKMDSLTSTGSVQGESYTFSGGHEDWRNEFQKKEIISKLKDFLAR